MRSAPTRSRRGVTVTTADSYTPTIPTGEWTVLRPFVLDVVLEVRGRVPYGDQALMHTVTHHAHWTHLVAGMPLERATMFRRDVIGSSVSMMPTSSPSTMGRTRSILLRVGEAVGSIERPSPLPSLPAADPSTPYGHAEVEDLRSWAYFQRDAGQRASAQTLLALGLGAGLPTRDLVRVRGVDVGGGGDVVRVLGGGFPRVVPVSSEWSEDLAEVLDQSRGTHLSLFQPGVLFHKNIVHTFVQRSIGLGLTPSTQRMRATWLVQRLREGTPMQNLLYSAGIKSMDALVRYQRFLPSPAAADVRDMSTDVPSSP